MSPVALACTWLLHMLSAQKHLYRTAPRRTSCIKEVMGSFCRATDVGHLALLGGARWWFLLPALLIPKGNFCCFGSWGRLLLWGFPNLGRTSCACRSVECCFQEGNTGERKHLPFVKNTKSYLELILPSWGFYEFRGVCVPVEVWKYGILFWKYGILF